MDRSEIEAIFVDIGNRHIGVLGDFCLDAYWTLAQGTPEYSIETGKPTEAVRAQRYAPGGAANIAANLASLQPGSVRAFSVVGDDLFGRELISLLTASGIDCSGLLIQAEQWQTPVYCKRYLGDEELERIDMGRFNVIGVETEQTLLDILDDALRSLDILIFNQQLSSGGVYTTGFYERLLERINKQSHCRVLLDFRALPSHFENMLLKLNAYEAAAYCGESWELGAAIPEDHVKKYAEHIFSQSQQPVMITRGSRGLLVYDGAQHYSVASFQFMKAIDPVGAGDTTVAAWAACVAAGVPLIQAAQIASLAAGVTVQKVQQTGTASLNEIVAFAEVANYVYHPEQADDLRLAQYLDGSQIEIISPSVAKGHLLHAVFDHDGTISVLREGWEPVMEAMMIRAILGDHYKEVSEADYHRITHDVRQFIDTSTGIQTIVQMQSLVEMVTEFGFVPQSDVLSAVDYKQIYNDALMVEINARKKRLECNELDVTDFTIKGAVEMLQRLRDHGVKLYLASGTDEEDVKIEAEILGYANLFEGRIYGAVGDITRYSKKLVIDRIIRENNLQGPELITFGDGPVEIRETKKRGGITAGLASDEVRRFGLNPVKRTRLIRAGADLIIPDYSQQEQLMHYLLG